MRVAFETVFRKRKGGHCPEQQNEEDRNGRDDETVLEIENEIPLPQNGIIPDKAECGRRRQAERITEYRCSGP